MPCRKATGDVLGRRRQLRRVRRRDAAVPKADARRAAVNDDGPAFQTVHRPAAEPVRIGLRRRYAEVRRCRAA